MFADGIVVAQCCRYGGHLLYCMLQIRKVGELLHLGKGCSFPAPDMKESPFPWPEMREFSEGLLQEFTCQSFERMTGSLASRLYRASCLSDPPHDAFGDRDTGFLAVVRNAGYAFRIDGEDAIEKRFVIFRAQLSKLASHSRLPHRTGPSYAADRQRRACVPMSTDIAGHPGCGDQEPLAREEGKRFQPGGMQPFCDLKIAMYPETPGFSPPSSL